jgi:hypothetical protein
MNPNLTTCRHCQKEVAKTAEKCPHCGGDHPGLSNNAVGLITLIAIGLAIYFVFSMRSCAKDVEHSAIELKESAEQAQKSLNEAQKNLSDLKRKYGQ